MEFFFSFGYHYVGRFREDLPGLLISNLFFAGINGFRDLQVVVSQELQGFFTGCSTFA